MSEPSTNSPGKIGRFYQELKKRRVFSAFIAYTVGGWLLIQVGDVVLPAFNAPAWILQALIATTVAFFPVFLVLAWVYDITRQGLVRTQAATPVKSTITERRQVTVLYGHFQWSGDESGEVDPEFLTDSLPDLNNVCSEIAMNFGGHLTRTIADGFAIYFGYPESHEFDARHAVEAGLDILRRIAEHGETMRHNTGMGVTVSVGIDSGTAVVEDSADPSEEFRVLGAVTSVAERIEGLVDFSHLSISERTAELVRGYFELDDLGKHTLRSGGNEITVYRVIKPSGAKTRLQTEGALVKFTGRDVELATLNERWEQTLDGSGQVVLITGDPGLGKSRLVHELKTVVELGASAWITECICSPDHTNRALYPAAAIVHQQLVASIEQADDASRMEKLVEVLTQFDFDLDQTAPLLATLLDLPYQDQFENLQLSPQLQRERILETLLHLLLVRADRLPLLLIIEDLHWADPSFLDLVQKIVEQGPESRILVVCTARPGTQLPWSQRTHVTQVSLTPLTAKQTSSLIGTMDSDRNLPVEVMTKVVETAQGNPLFAEELMRGVADAIARNAAPTDVAADLRIPATLQESLLARLDRLSSTTKNVARLAATLGREFSYQLAQSFATSLGLPTIDDDLRTLVSADVLYQRGMAPNFKYVFKHILFQEAAYQSLLKSEREDYHGRIVRLLQDEWPDVCERQPEQLARHQEFAGYTRDAVIGWTRAGQAAARQSALLEATSYLQHALTLQRRLPASKERDAAELDLQISLGPVLMALRGFSASEVYDAYQRAEELCDTNDPSPKTVAVISGLWSYSITRGALQSALGFSDKLLEVTNRSNNDDLIMQALVLAGVTRTYTGPMHEALKNLSTVLDLYDHEKHQGQAFLYGQNPYMVGLSYSAIAKFWMGESSEARELASQAVEFARDIKHPRSLAFSLANGARSTLRCADLTLSVEFGAEAASVADTYGFPDFSAMGRFHQHAAEYLLSPGDDVLQRAEKALDDLGRVGNSLSMPFNQSVMADCLSRHCLTDKAELRVKMAEDALLRHGTDADEAEVYRVKGMVLWRKAKQLDDSSLASEAQRWIERAVAVASEQGAIGWQKLAEKTIEDIS